MNFAVFTVLILASIKASAIPLVERPILTAEMIEFSDDAGHERHRKTQMTLNQRDFANSPTSILVEEGIPIRFCLVAPCPKPVEASLFRIAKITKDDCGSTVYRAYPVSFAIRRPLTLLLIDHVTRLCEDYRKYRWEAVIQPSVVGRPREFAGNPLPVLLPVSDQ